MKFIGSMLFFISFLFSAQSFLTKQSVIAGDRVVLVLSAKGNNIKFPKILRIDKYDILSTGMEQGLEYINGRMIKQIEKHYAFIPLKSVDIESFVLEVDGKKEFTKPLHVEVKKVDTTNSPFTLEMKIKNSDIMQFEAVPIEFIFKRDSKYEVRDLRFSPPEFKNFWVKEGKKTKPEFKNGFVIHKMNFFLFAQKSGDFEINPAKIDVGVMNKNRDIFNTLAKQLSWKTVFSNPLPLHVKRLEGASLYGDFDISLDIDKKEIKENRAVNVTLRIVGNGNFDDIKSYRININGGNTYADKPTITSHPTTRGIQGEFTQKFSISSNKDFTIPALSIVYYDAKTKKIITKKTKTLDIHVKSLSLGKPVQATSVPKELLIKDKNNYISLIFAFIMGILVTIFVLYLFRKKKYKLPRFKNDRDRLKALLKIRGESEEIDKQILDLEKKLMIFCEV